MSRPVRLIPKRAHSLTAIRYIVGVTSIADVEAFAPGCVVDRHPGDDWLYVKGGRTNVALGNGDWLIRTLEGLEVMSHVTVAERYNFEVMT